MTTGAREAGVSARVGPAGDLADGARVIRLVLIVVAGLVVALGLGVLWLGMLPPEPAPQRIERPVPIDRGGTGATPATPAAPAAPAQPPPRR